MGNRNKISFMAIMALVISLVAFTLYAMLLSGINVYTPWIICGIVSLVFPILSKYNRKKKGLKGKTIEIIALVIGAFDFYFVFFAATTWNIYIVFGMIAALCVVYAKCFNKTMESNGQEMDEKEHYDDAESMNPHVTTRTKQEDKTETSKAVKQRYCKYCGGAIDSESRKCTKCGKQYFHVRIKWRAAIAVMLIICLVGANVYQYIQYKNHLTALQEEINDLQAEITGQSLTISSQAKTINTQKARLSYTEEEASYFNEICKNLRSGNLGYAASNFRVDRAVVILGCLDTNEQITLTANWSGGGTVSIDHSSNCAELIFDDNSWQTSVTLSVVPYEEGVTVATFSNDVNSQSFKVLIIVSGL